MSGDVPENVSRETFERLKTYEALLKQWNPKINLVSRSTLDDAWTRHFQDSIQVEAILPADTRTLADLGSGGGFPGLVLAILFAETRPDAQVTLIESDQRKCTFLRTVLRETGVGARILPERIEKVPRLGVDVITARALAPLTQLLEHAERHLRPGGHAYFLKGAQFRAEIEEALATWAFSREEIPSTTSPEAAILKIGDLARV